MMDGDKTASETAKELKRTPKESPPAYFPLSEDPPPPNYNGGYFNPVYETEEENKTNTAEVIKVVAQIALILIVVHKICQ